MIHVAVRHPLPAAAPRTQGLALGVDMKGHGLRLTAAVQETQCPRGSQPAQGTSTEAKWALRQCRLFSLITGISVCCSRFQLLTLFSSLPAVQEVQVQSMPHSQVT